MWITQPPKIVVNLLENLQIFHTNGTVVLGKVILTEKCRWVPLMSQQTEDRGQKNNDRFSKLLLHGRLAVLSHHSQSEQFVLMWTGLEAGSGPLASPVFVKLERRWRLYFQKGLVRLKYIQGLEDIAVVPRQVVVDGSSNHRPLYSCP